MTKPLPDRQESAYWLALAFHLERDLVRNKNGLVLTADRKAGLGLLDLVTLDTAELPVSVQRFAATHEKLLQAEGRVSAQAFVVDRLLENKFDVVPITHPSYPQRLAEVLTPSKAPTVLITAGSLDLLQASGVAVSGSRKAGPAGIAFARELGRSLARAGVPVITGLARGVDTAALEGALGAGGVAIGVSPEGILNTAAAKRAEIADGRLLVISEFAPTARWAGWAAMKRNHTIAGLSHALVIAECVAEGGTTAQLTVHRDLSIPAFVRRGHGEGELMERLANQPGVMAIAWEEGTIELPPGVDQATTTRVLSRLSRENGKLVIHLEAPQEVPFREVADALRKIWPNGAAEPDLPVRAQEPTPPPYESNAAVTAKQIADPIMAALRGLPGHTGTVSELSEEVRWSKAKARKRLHALVEEGLVSIDRSGRAHTFTLRASGDSSESTSTSRRAPPAQLGLIPDPAD